MIVYDSQEAAWCTDTPFIMNSSAYSLTVSHLYFEHPKLEQFISHADPNEKKKCWSDFWVGEPIISSFFCFWETTSVAGEHKIKNSPEIKIVYSFGFIKNKKKDSLHAIDKMMGVKNSMRARMREKKNSDADIRTTESSYVFVAMVWRCRYVLYAVDE